MDVVDDNYDDDDSYSDVVPAEGRPMRASLSSFIVHGKLSGQLSIRQEAVAHFCRGCVGRHPCDGLNRPNHVIAISLTNVA